MKIKVLYLLISILVCLLIIIFGNHYYHTKIQRTSAVAKEEIKSYDLQQKKEEANAKAKKIADEKKIYQQHKGKELVYVPMGDSLAEGWYASTKSKDYVNLLSSIVHQKMGYNVKIRDDIAVKAGTGLKDEGLLRINEVLAANPNFVTVEFGTNDLQTKLNNAYSNPKQFEIRLNDLLKQLKSASSHPKILLVTTWNGGQLSQTYDQIIYSVAKKYNFPVADISSVWANRSDTMGPKGESSFAGTGISDGWHPNDKGHKEIAESIYKKAYDLLK